jgi:hypothetical protein
LTCSRSDLSEDIEIHAQSNAANIVGTNVSLSLGEFAFMHMHRMFVHNAGIPLSGDEVIQLLDAPDPLPKFYDTSGTLWCTEGYVAALSKAGYKQFDHVIGHAQLREEFEKNNALTTLRYANTGDWLEIDTNNNGKPNHSGMYVGIDYKTGNIITLEANAYNKHFAYMVRPIRAIKTVGCVSCLAY